MERQGQNGPVRMEDGPSSPASPSLQQYDQEIQPFYLGKEAAKQHGVLNRTFSSLNPFKVRALTWPIPDQIAIETSLKFQQFSTQECVQPVQSDYEIFFNLLQKNKAGGGWFNPEDFTAQKVSACVQFGQIKDENASCYTCPVRQESHASDICQILSQSLGVLVVNLLLKASTCRGNGQSSLEETSNL